MGQLWPSKLRLRRVIIWHLYGNNSWGYTSFCKHNRIPFVISLLPHLDCWNHHNTWPQLRINSHWQFLPGELQALQLWLTFAPLFSSNSTRVAWFQIEGSPWAGLNWGLAGTFKVDFQYLNVYWVDFNEILCRHSWSPDDEPNDIGNPLIFPPAPPSRLVVLIEMPHQTLATEFFCWHVHVPLWIVIPLRTRRLLVCLKNCQFIKHFGEQPNSCNDWWHFHQPLLHKH